MTTNHRTPDSRFAAVQDYPFTPNYFELSDGLRMHYCDEGPRDGPVILMMHGEPSWSYLYRKMIGPVADAGYRVLAPDLVGFGKSDKPTSIDAYSYDSHIAWIREWFEAMDVRDVILVCQDWGSLIGLAVADRTAGQVRGGRPVQWRPARRSNPTAGFRRLARIFENQSRFRHRIDHSGGGKS